MNFYKFLLISISFFGVLLLISHFSFLSLREISRREIISPGVAFAEDIAIPGGTGKGLEEAVKNLEALSRKAPFKQASGFWSVISKILQWTYTIFFIVAIFFILVAAYHFLFAQGDPEKVKGARSQILWAAVAIAIALISVAAAQIINSFLKS